MYYSEIKLTNFRNILNLNQILSKRLNIFVGENGQGKTNLIESLYFSVMGKTFRQVEKNALINNKNTSCCIDSIIIENNLEHKIKNIISDNKKEVMLHGKKTNHKEIMKRFSCVIFSPESLSSIKESSETRRNLIDEVLINFKKKNVEIISDFKKVLITKNRILRNFKEKKVSYEQTQELIHAINPLFLKQAHELTIERIDTLQCIYNDFNVAMQYISGERNVDISVEYLISSINSMHQSSELILETMKKRLKEMNEKELMTGTSLVGPHKHDITFLYGQKDSRFYCSQGQQRAIILAFKIAQIVQFKKINGFYPVLFLDDVLSELDQSKREFLIKFLHEIKTQTFITTTEIDLSKKFNLEENKVFKIFDGQVVEN